MTIKINQFFLKMPSKILMHSIILSYIHKAVIIICNKQGNIRNKMEKRNFFTNVILLTLKYVIIIIKEENGNFFSLSLSIYVYCHEL